METAMQQFLCIHTVPANAMTRQQLEQMSQAAQTDPDVRGYRSFVSPAAGKAVCIMEAADEAAVASWFTRMGMPVDSISRLELEGERGMIRDAKVPEIAGV
jgi:hypothetical protein